MRPLLVALFLLVAAGAARAQDEPRLVTSLSASRVMVGATVIFEVRVVVGEPKPTTFGPVSLPPSLEIVSRQDFSHDQIAVPGGRTRVVQRNFVLAPNRAGVYQIPSVAVDVDGQTLRTDPLTLEVVPGAPTPEPARRRESEGVRMRASLDASTVYVGQQVILEAEATFPRDFRQRQTRPATFETPNPPGFWISEIPGGLIGGVRWVNGEVHETQTYRRIYVPLTAGEYVIDPVSLRYEVRRGYLYSPESGELFSDSLRLRVLPVPVDDRPDSYTGAVGAYSVRAWLQPDRVAAGDAATLTVEISGTGNVKTLPPPRLPDVGGVEIFPPTEDANVSFRGMRLAGAKRFTWVLVPERAGTVDLGTLSYGFFDPVAERFDVARTVPLRLDVVPVVALNGNAADTALSPVRMQSSRPPLNGLLESPIFAAAQAVPLLALLAVVALRRRRTAPAAAQRELRARWEGALGEVKSDVASDVGAFLGQLTALVRSALAEIAGQDTFRTISLEGLRADLEELGVNAYTATSVMALLRRLDQARFGRTPLDTSERAALVDEAQGVLARVQSELRPAMPRTGVRTGATALLFICAAASPVAGQNAFRDGVAAYIRGEYALAGDRFADHLAASPEDAAGWYNLGNARKGEGRGGEAVLAWRRALELEPRMTEARHNLRLAGGSAALAGAPPRFAPTAVEAALLLSILWWIAAGALTWAILRESRFARRTAQATLGIAAIIILAGLPGWLRADVAIALDPLTPLLAGPAMRSDTVVTVPAGTPLRVVGREGDWLRVRTSDLAEGWGAPGGVASVRNRDGA
jgi:tetratricopeptide (TPR) repeat protein